ncbi:MAG: DUF763 domain-containing protein [Nitrospirae bacterium]|nr:MAG: DUF763 domain-containing protein [Nitrospirota bacterium]
MKIGTATAPLHNGKAPAWLFKRMKALAGAIVSAIVVEFGTVELLRKLSDPFWFQAFGCTIGFDWHSSGLTTTLTGAIKEGLRGMESELGLFVAGGKGKASRKTPEEIKIYGDREGIEADSLIYASRITAKVDNSAVQDGYQLYHHSIFFDRSGNWAVVQQGMNEEQRMARRYHWLSDTVKCFVEDPHKAVCSDKKGITLNLVHKDSREARSLIPELLKRPPEKNLQDLKSLIEGDHLFMPVRHRIKPTLDIHPERFYRTLLNTYKEEITDFEDLLGLRGIGPKTIRALSLIGELIYGVKPSYEDPARFSYAVGGKDGTPYPVDRTTYDSVIDIMKKAVESSSVENSEKLKAIRRLFRFYEGNQNK